ncbi:hypothetical protein [Dactylosporangium sp. NPDC000521]|uniref:hypothetical protein n=1 Tax=Dactylosporangium sp. NPDC000521 TaxID=3363975 RepID=UPI0036BDCB0C
MPDSAVEDEVRSVRALLSRYVGGELPIELRGAALANGIPDDSWVFPRREDDTPAAEDGHGPVPEDAVAAGRQIRDAAHRSGLSMLVPGDAGWPAGTGAVDVPCLWVRGDRDVASLLRRATTVTGARACTAYGAHLAAEIAAALERVSKSSAAVEVTHVIDR